MLLFVIKKKTYKKSFLFNQDTIFIFKTLLYYIQKKNKSTSIQKLPEPLF